MNNTRIDDIIQSAFIAVNEVPRHSDTYITGVLLNDHGTQRKLEIFTCIHAIIIQSLQINNQKRALRYLIALKIINSKSVDEKKLRESITSQLIAPV